MTKNPSPKATIIDIMTVANWLQGKIAEILSPYNISMQQLKVLAIVHDQPKKIAIVNTIREQMQDPMSNVSRLLNKLMDRGLVRKEHSLEDQRVVYIHLTPDGIVVMKEGRKAIDEGLHSLCHLSGDELAQMSQLLKKIKP